MPGWPGRVQATIYGRQGAGGEFEHDREGIVDVPGFPSRRGPAGPARCGGLHRRYLARHHPGQVHVMAAALEQVSAARTHVGEPRAALCRPYVGSDQEPDLLARQQPGQFAEQVQRMPLVPDGADRAGTLGGRHDVRGVLERAGDRFLQVDGQPMGQGGDGRVPVGSGRGADEQRPEVLPVEQVTPIRVGSRTGAGGQDPGAFEVEVAHRREPGVGHGIQYAAVLLGDPAGPDHAHPDRVHAAVSSRGTGNGSPGAARPLCTGRT